MSIRQSSRFQIRKSVAVSHCSKTVFFWFIAIASNLACIQVAISQNNEQLPNTRLSFSDPELDHWLESRENFASLPWYRKMKRDGSIIEAENTDLQTRLFRAYQASDVIATTPTRSLYFPRKSIRVRLNDRQECESVPRLIESLKWFPDISSVTVAGKKMGRRLLCDITSVLFFSPSKLKLVHQHSLASVPGGVQWRRNHPESNLSERRPDRLTVRCLLGVVMKDDSKDRDRLLDYGDGAVHRRAYNRAPL